MWRDSDLAGTSCSCDSQACSELIWLVRAVSAEGVSTCPLWKSATVSSNAPPLCERRWHSDLLEVVCCFSFMSPVVFLALLSCRHASQEACDLSPRSGIREIWFYVKRVLPRPALGRKGMLSESLPFFSRATFRESIVSVHLRSRGLYLWLERVGPLMRVLLYHSHWRRDGCTKADVDAGSLNKRLPLSPRCWDCTAASPSLPWGPVGAPWDSPPRPQQVDLSHPFPPQISEAAEWSGFWLTPRAGSQFRGGGFEFSR